MPFIRLSDDYNDHPKFTALSDGAFRLWHQAIGFCRKYETDGQIPMTRVRQFRAYTPKRVGELLMPWTPGAHALWRADGNTDNVVITVHDYLEWNLSKEEGRADRDAAKLRMRRLRSGGPGDARAMFARTSGGTSREVLDREGSSSSSERECERKPDAGERAARLIEHYAQWYPQYRHGAKLRLVGSPLEFQDALSLCDTWDDERLELLAKIVLTTDDEFIAGTDRSFKIFALKASWADGRLAEAQKVKA